MNRPTRTLRLLALSLPAMAKTDAANRPNFVFFLADDRPYLGMQRPALASRDGKDGLT
jgi:hypothetical protein